MLEELFAIWEALPQERKDKILYSWIHHCKVVEMAKEMEFDNAVIWHDMDKIALLLLTPLSKQTINILHKQQPHHKRDNTDAIIESIIDFEASSYTKMDKPQNAWGTLDKLECFKNTKLRNLAERIIVSLGYETYPIDREITKEQYQAMVNQVNITDMLNHIINYLQYKIV